MKLLHTADWHVGKTLQGRSRIDEQRDVLAEIVERAQDQAADAVLVAGDLFDSAAPSPVAEELVYKTLLALREIAPVVVVPGNHDGLQRLAAMTPLFAKASIHVRAGVDTRPVELSAGGERLQVACIPWLSQRYIVKAAQLMELDAQGMASRFFERMQQIVTALTSSMASDAVRVLLGHITIADAELGGGERSAQTIFDYWVPTTIFPNDLHYVALGHIHKAQQRPGPCPIWYCGSPVHLDFSDTDDSKAVLMVQAGPQVPAKVSAVALERGRRLRTIEGTLEQLSALGDQGDDFLRVIVREQARTGLGEEIRALFPNAVKVQVQAEIQGSHYRRGADRRNSSARDLFVEYLGNKGVDDPALVRLFDELHEEAHATDAA